MSAPASPQSDKSEQDLDSELPSEVAVAVETDPAAAEEVEDLKRVLALVAELPPPPAPEGFVDRVARRARRRQIVAQPHPLSALPFQVLSILIILGVAALLLLSEFERRPVEPAEGGDARSVLTESGPSAPGNEAPPSE